MIKLRGFLMVVLACTMGLALTACKKGESGSTTSTKDTGDRDQAAAAEQTLCPVSGDKIEKDVFVMHKDKKVYFCCDDCKKPFEKEPAKYVAKLPQFGGKETPGEYEGS